MDTNRDVGDAVNAASPWPESHHGQEEQEAPLDYSHRLPLEQQEGKSHRKKRRRWSETAWQWFQRCQERRAYLETPRNPSSAAWLFLKKPNTGLPFINVALRQQEQQQNTMPNLHSNEQDQKGTFLEIRGITNTGKTATLLSLAAQFVLQTSPSRFRTSSSLSSTTDKNRNDNDISKLPQVIILDGNHDITATRIACAVRSVLLRNYHNNNDNGTTTNNRNSNDTHNNTQQKNDNNDNIDIDEFEQEMYQCLNRIHVIFPEDSSAAMFSVSILESLYYKLSNLYSNSNNQDNNMQQQSQMSHSAAAAATTTIHNTLQHPTLVLWDGFTLGNDFTTSHEIVRQLKRLVHDCFIFLVTTVLDHPFTTTNKNPDTTQTLSTTTTTTTTTPYDKCITHRIRLHRFQQQDQHQEQQDGTTTTMSTNNTPHHDYYALLSNNDTQIPFSISLGGVLS